MSWYESILWLYLIGVVCTTVYILQLIFRKAPRPLDLDIIFRFTIVNGLLWPLLLLEFFSWCSEFTRSDDDV